MKEMRARKSAEKMVESKFKDEVQQQRSRLKQVDEKSKNMEPPGEVDLDRKSEVVDRKSRPPVLYNESSTESSGAESSASRDSSPSSDSDTYQPPRKNGPVARASFATALLRAGTKSTKDSTLEKTKAQAKDKEAEEKKPVVRKVAGQLLQTAGKGLLNVIKKDKEEEDDLFKPASSCISFGLYGGHLSVDKDSAAQNSLRLDDRPYLSLLSEQKPLESTKKIFSNWGGEFFKKNLDFRANTNKILEKMQLNKAGGAEFGANGASHVQNSAIDVPSSEV